MSSDDSKVNCWHKITERHSPTDFWAFYFTILQYVVWARKNGRESVPFFDNYWKKGHSHGLKNEPTAGFLTKTGKKRHKKALYDKFAEVKVVFKTTRKDYIFFQIF